MTAPVLSFSFIILWSSAFISAKAIMADGTAFASLALRFAIVAGGFGCAALIMHWRTRPSRFLTLSETCHAAIAGCLLHGFYLGGVFWALSHGMQATLAALIISLQPVFTALLAGPLLGERITARNWLGILLGFMGALLVIGFDIGGAIPVPALLICCGALLAAITGTLYQKQFGQDMPLLPMNMVQAGAAMILHLILLALFEVPSITLTTSYIVGMAWQIGAVSFGAYVMFMILLSRGSSQQTSSLLFLIAPVAAVQGWIILGETLTMQDMIGLGIASAGVYLATRRLAPS